VIPKLSGCGRRFGRFIPQLPLRGNGVVVPRHRSSRRSCAPGFEQWDYKLHAGYAKETQRLLLAHPGGRRVLENILGRIKDRMLRARSLCGPLAMKQSLLNFDVVWSCRPPQLKRFTVANRKSCRKSVCPGLVKSSKTRMEFFVLPKSECFSKIDRESLILKSGGLRWPHKPFQKLGDSFRLLFLGGLGPPRPQNRPTNSHSNQRNEVSSVAILSQAGCVPCCRQRLP
jgi:hypothetical protein